MKKLVFFMILSTQIVVGFGQTAVQGIINSNVTFTKNKSPYLVTGDLVVFPNWKLTIEPGVELRFADDVTLQIRGTLVALGTETDSISFVSNTGTSQGLWQGIKVMSTLGGNASFNYCNFSHASTAVDDECCVGGIEEIRNSHFTFNIEAIGVPIGKPVYLKIENCYFANNESSIVGGFKMINHCIFENNEYGLKAGMVYVSNSTFTNHSQAALYGGNGELTNCIITGNNIGVKGCDGGFTIEKCDISNNQVGIELDDYLYDSGRYVSPVNNSTICNNIQYNVKNNSICDVELYTNCWCTSDSTEVENLIYDAWDNYNVGFVNYTLFVDDCSQPILRTFKAENRVEYYPYPTGIRNLTNNENLIYPNPAYSTLFIRNTEKLTNIRIYDLTGMLLMDRFGFDEELIELNVSEFRPGIYIVRLTNQKNEIEFKKILIAR